MADVSARPRVGLFVTCLVDFFRPSVGFAAVKLLEDAGCVVEVPEAQTCCGQPAYNSGDRHDTKDLARRTIAAFEGFDYVVVPSGSCGGMIKEHYPELLADEPDWAHRAQHLAARTYELVSFLHDVRGLRNVAARYDGVVTYHDSCSGLRELGVKQQPRALLQSIAGLKLRRAAGRRGVLRLRRHVLRQVSGNLRQDGHGDKAADIAATGADTLLAGDWAA